LNLARWLKASLVALLVLAAAGARADEVPARLEHVRLQLKWRHQFQFAGYYVALEKGYYRDAGLDVTIVPAQPGIDPIDKVLSKRPSSASPPRSWCCVTLGAIPWSCSASSSSIRP